MGNPRDRSNGGVHSWRVSARRDYSDGFQGKLSMNGTKVNGVSLNMSEKIELNPGDQIVLGGLLKLNVKFE